MYDLQRFLCFLLAGFLQSGGWNSRHGAVSSSWMLVISYTNLNRFSVVFLLSPTFSFNAMKTWGDVKVVFRFVGSDWCLLLNVHMVSSNLLCFVLYLCWYHGNAGFSFLWVALSVECLWPALKKVQLFVLCICVGCGNCSRVIPYPWYLVWIYISWAHFHTTVML